MFEKCTITVFMKEVANAEHTDHFYSPIYNVILNRENPFWKFAEGLKDLQSSILVPIYKRGLRIGKIRIRSHGNKNPPKLRLENGPVIRMGEDNLSLHDFDQEGNPNSRLVKNFLMALKNALTESGEVTFDACNQKSGDLLKNISRFLGKDIVVKGFSGFGNPLGRGDMSYRNGICIK